MASDLSKLRKVLDFVPSASMTGWKERRYFDALNRRLNRQVLVESRGAARPARDEAVLVVAPDEWDAAQAARERQLLQEAELEHARAEVARVQSREADLQAEIEALGAKLDALKVEREEKRRAGLQLVGVRRALPPAPAAEVTPLSPEALAEAAPVAPEPEPGHLAEAGWEVLGEEPAPGEAPASDVEDVLAGTGWELAEEGPTAPAAPAPVPAGVLASEADATEEAISRVEHEIEKIEKELASLATQEKDLRARPAGEAFTSGAFTLYRRRVGKGSKARDFYFFSRTVPAVGEPSPLPRGYKATVNARTRVPILKKAGGRKAPRPKKGR